MQKKWQNKKRELKSFLSLAHQLISADSTILNCIIDIIIELLEDNNHVHLTADLTQFCQKSCNLIQAADDGTKFDDKQSAYDLSEDVFTVKI